MIFESHPIVVTEHKLITNLCYITSNKNSCTISYYSILSNINSNIRRYLCSRTKWYVSSSWFKVMSNQWSNWDTIWKIKISRLTAVILKKQIWSVKNLIVCVYRMVIYYIVINRQVQLQRWIIITIGTKSSSWFIWLNTSCVSNWTTETYIGQYIKVNMLWY